MEELMFVIASVTIGFALVSNQFERSLITPPMIFTALGVLAYFFLPEMLGELDGRAVLEVIAELTLVVVLFIDASRIRCRCCSGSIVFRCECWRLDCH